MIDGLNEALVWCRPLTHFVKNTINGLLLRFFTMPAELRALSPERVRRLSQLELRFLSASQLQILGIEWLPPGAPKVYPKVLSVEGLFQELLRLYDSKNLLEKKLMSQEIVKEKEETLLFVVTLGETKKRYIPTIFLIESFLINKRSLKWMAPHLTNEGITAVITRIQNKPIIHDFVREVAPLLSPDAREALYQFTHPTVWRRSRKNLTVQENINSDKV